MYNYVMNLQDRRRRSRLAIGVPVGNGFLIPQVRLILQEKANNIIKTIPSYL